MKHKSLQHHLLMALIVTVCSLAASPAFAQMAAGCGTGTLGGMICNFMNGTSTLPGIFAGFSYMAGLICGFMAIMKLREHVESPSQVPIWEPIKRFIAGGAFLAAPRVVAAVRTLLTGSLGGVSTTSSGFNGKASGVGLDTMLTGLVSDLLTPMVWATGWIGWLGGLIFVFIGISRLLKSEQQGAQGPTGIGTIMTFIVAGALFSLNSMVSFLNGTIFGDNSLDTHGVLTYTAGLGGAVDHVHAVISAIIGFAMIIGWISLVRGLFIVRSVSEGNSQASMMAAVTHLIGGALAINLGNVIMAVQNTLGITSYGITFS